MVFTVHIALVDPDLSHGHSALGIPFAGIGERPCADHRRAGVAVDLHVPQPSSAHLHAAAGAAVNLVVSGKLVEDLRERDVEQLRLLDEGVAREEAEGEVDPPEHPAVGDGALRVPVPGQRG